MCRVENKSYGPVIGENSEQQAAENKKPSFLELNPLFNPFPFGDNRYRDAFKNIALEKIEEYGGEVPIRFDALHIESPATHKSEMRWVIRFETEINEKKLALLEGLVGSRYSEAVRTTIGPDGKEMYPDIQRENDGNNRVYSYGWYMGPNQEQTDPLHTGLFVFRNLGVLNKESFINPKFGKEKCFVEIREAMMPQVDLVEMAVQIGAILGKSELIDYSKLYYETYYSLMRLSLRKIDKNNVFGLEEVIGKIKRGLLTPLANKNFSERMGIYPESVLICGVPGTGKTLTAECLLQEDTGVLIVPVEPMQLENDFNQDPSRRKILRRAAQIMRDTDLPIVFQMDDIENIVPKDSRDTSNSTLLNLMAGVRDSGFFVIASTNEPDKIPTALIQPQRLGILIHSKLIPDGARLSILEANAPLYAKCGLMTFESSEVRNLILGEVAKMTEGFTPRFLAEICNVAKAYFLERIASEKGKTTNLSEADLEGCYYSAEDWIRALGDVSNMYDKVGMTKMDEAIGKFVNHKTRGIGFHSESSKENIISSDLAKKLTAARLRNQQS